MITSVIPFRVHACSALVLVVSLGELVDVCNCDRGCECECE